MLLYQNCKWLIGFGYNVDKPKVNMQKIYHDLWKCGAGLHPHTGHARWHFAHLSLEQLIERTDCIIEFAGLHSKNHNIYYQSLSTLCTFIHRIGAVEYDTDFLFNQSHRLSRLADYLQTHGATQTSSVSITYSINFSKLGVVTVHKTIGLVAQWRDSRAFQDIAELHRQLSIYLAKYQCTGQFT